MKEFLDYPASPYVLFNPPTCQDCNKVLIEGSYFCDKCVERRRELLIMADEKRLAPKPNDAGFYYIMTCVVIVMVAAYSYLIWCLL